MVTWKDFMLPIMQHYESVLCSSSLHLLDQKYRKKTNIVKYYYNLKECLSILIYLKNIICKANAKLNLSSSLLQSSVHDPSSEIILICWFIINIRNSCAAYFIFLFFWNLWYFLGFSNKKNSIYSKYRCFLTISIFTITVSINLANLILKI